MGKRVPLHLVESPSGLWFRWWKRRETCDRVVVCDDPLDTATGARLLHHASRRRDPAIERAEFLEPVQNADLARTRRARSLCPTAPNSMCDSPSAGRISPSLHSISPPDDPSRSVTACRSRPMTTGCPSHRESTIVLPVRFLGSGCRPSTGAAAIGKIVAEPMSGRGSVRKDPLIDNDRSGSTKNRKNEG